MPSNSDISYQRGLYAAPVRERPTEEHQRLARRWLKDQRYQLTAERKPFPRVVATLEGSEVGHVEFLISSVASSRTMAQSGDKLWVHKDHRGQKIATAMYVLAEAFFGATIVKATEQTDAAQGFWEQSDRPFGNLSEGALVAFEEE